MKPGEYKFATLPQFLHIILHNPATRWVYRGQSSVLWPLLPKAGRLEYFLKATDYWAERGESSSDLGRFDEWRKNAIAYFENLPENDFECLAFAQHYGLATRLLDWTENPLVALYFAVEEHSDTDGAVFCYYQGAIVVPEEATFARLKQVALYKPRPFDRRILSQSGVFTYHPDPQKPLEAKPMTDKNNEFAPDGLDLVTIRVDAKLKPIFQRQLSEIGISRKTLFPDLEGLSEFVNWWTRYVAGVNKKNKERAD
jgi:hypothetical protein